MVFTSFENKKSYEKVSHSMNDADVSRCLYKNVLSCW